MSFPELLPLFDRLVEQPARPSLSLTLRFDQRQKRRLRAVTDEGREVALILQRGQVLRGGTLLTGPNNEVLVIVAAPERLSEVTSDNPWELTRAAYHLGNRHICLQIGNGWVRYLSDRVLDAMVNGLGFPVRQVDAPFEPEAGAYQTAQHHHHRAESESDLETHRRHE